MSNKCDFDKAWIGKCGEPVTDHGKCVTHAPIKCASCGSSATHECAAKPYTDDQLEQLELAAMYEEEPEDLDFYYYV